MALTPTAGPQPGPMAGPLVGIVMGSRSDWPTMREAARMLDAFGISHESKVVSAHRTPDRLVAYAKGAAARRHNGARLRPHRLGAADAGCAGHAGAARSSGRLRRPRCLANPAPFNHNLWNMGE